MNVYVLIYGGSSENMSDYSSDTCWVGTRIIQAKNAAGHHVYEICYFNSYEGTGTQTPTNLDGTHLVYNDTTADLLHGQSYNAQQAAVDACAANMSPPVSTVQIEYMAAYPNPCTSPCWELVGGTTVSVTMSYPELYWGNKPPTYVEPLLSAWENKTYGSWPSVSAGTMAETPFLNANTSFYQLWSALQTDVYDLCRNTQVGDLSIYVGSLKNLDWNEATNPTGTPNAEQQTAIALDDCI